MNGFKDTLFSQKHTINCKGRIVDFNSPRVMGIMNCTPDSFYDGGQLEDKDSIVRKTEQMVAEGTDIIDIGAYSSRPGAKDITIKEEINRLACILPEIKKRSDKVIISVDTFRSEVAGFVIREFGVDIINDISAGMLDMEMFELIGEYSVPYIMMHMPGNPAIMQNYTNYKDITRDILSFFAQRIDKAKKAGIDDIIIDPGFGFGKTIDQNFKLLKDLHLFTVFGYPVLAGMSRKSMIYKPLDTDPQGALNGTSILNTIALNNGARILRVHDVKAAKETVQLFSLYTGA